LSTPRSTPSIPETSFSELPELATKRVTHVRFALSAVLVGVTLMARASHASLLVGVMRPRLLGWLGIS
jgi:hypothetical protein